MLLKFGVEYRITVLGLDRFGWEMISAQSNYSSLINEDRENSTHIDRMSSNKNRKTHKKSTKEYIEPKQLMVYLGGVT